MTTEETKRIVKVFIDGKHVKSFPLILKNSIKNISAETINTLSKSKTLSSSDVGIISHFVFPRLKIRL